MPITTTNMDTTGMTLETWESIAQEAILEDVQAQVRAGQEKLRIERKAFEKWERQQRMRGSPYKMAFLAATVIEKEQSIKRIRNDAIKAMRTAQNFAKKSTNVAKTEELNTELFNSLLADFTKAFDLNPSWVDAPEAKALLSFLRPSADEVTRTLDRNEWETKTKPVPIDPESISVNCFRDAVFKAELMESVESGDLQAEQAMKKKEDLYALKWKRVYTRSSSVPPRPTSFERWEVVGKKPRPQEPEFNPDGLGNVIPQTTNRFSHLYSIPSGDDDEVIHNNALDKQWGRRPVKRERLSRSSPPKIRKQNILSTLKNENPFHGLVFA